MGPLEKANGRPRLSFVGFDDGWWEAAESVFDVVRGKDWHMVPSSASGRKDRRAYEVNGATEHHPGFRKALREMVAAYPQLADYSIEFEGPWMKVRDVIHEQEPEAWEDIIFLHGTSERAWEAIRRQGLLPRVESGAEASYGAYSSAPEGDPRLTYLTTQPLIAQSAARQAAKKAHSRAVVLVVHDIDGNLVRADEDSGKGSARRSLEKMGTIAYAGRVPPENLFLYECLSDDGQWIGADHSAPHEKGACRVDNPTTDPDVDYRGSHEAPQADTGAPLWDLSLLYPDDVYGPDGTYLYGYEPGSGAAMGVILGCKNRPNRKVKIYRAVPLGRLQLLKKWEKYLDDWYKLPADAKDEPFFVNRKGLVDREQLESEIAKLESQPQPKPNKINPGDWVTLVRSYAVLHGQSNLRNRYKIISKTVPAYSLFSEANSLMEWGYDPVGGKAMVQGSVQPRMGKALDGNRLGSNPTYDANPINLARLNILDDDAFEQMTELEGKAWAKREQKNAGEPNTFFDAKEGFQILIDGGLAGKTMKDPDTGKMRPIMIGDITGSAGFVGAQDEIYVVSADGQIVLFGDTASPAKVKKALRVLQVLGTEPKGFRSEVCDKMFEKWAELAREGKPLPHAREQRHILYSRYDPDDDVGITMELADRYVECGRAGYESVAGPSNEQYLISLDRLPKLEEKVERLARKTLKLKLEDPLRLEVVGETTRPITDDLGRPTGKVRVYKIVEVRGSAPVLEGYSFIARLQHTPVGNIIARAPDTDVAIPDKMRDGLPTCDHCATTRDRKETFILRKDDTGKLIRVGRNCLADFLRSADAAAALSLWAIMDVVAKEERDEEDEERTGGGKIWFDTRGFVARAFRAIEVHGWVSGKRSYEDNIPSTKDYANASYFEPMPGARKESYDAWRELQPKSANFEQADAAIQWAQELAGKSDYEHNLKVVATLDVVENKTEGILASLPFAYKKHMGDLEESKRKAKGQTSEFFGEPGHIYIRQLTVYLVREIESSGYSFHAPSRLSHLYLMRDAQGNVFKWFSSGGDAHPRYDWSDKGSENRVKEGRVAMHMIEGDTLWFKFSVKSHDSYKGSKQTSITRAKLSEEMPKVKWLNPDTGEVFKTKKAAAESASSQETK